MADNTPRNAGIVPEWAYNMDVHANVEYNFEDHGTEFTLPSVAQQWKEDMKRRVRNVRRTNPGADPVLRAPQQFIDTGRWPKESN